jgi:hypothetical protein
VVPEVDVLHQDTSEGKFLLLPDAIILLDKIDK